MPATMKFSAIRWGAENEKSDHEHVTRAGSSRAPPDERRCMSRQALATGGHGGASCRRRARTDRRRSAVWRPRRVAAILAKCSPRGDRVAGRAESAWVGGGGIRVLRTPSRDSDQRSRRMAYRSCRLRAADNLSRELLRRRGSPRTGSRSCRKQPPSTRRGLHPSDSELARHHFGDVHGLTRAILPGFWW